MVGLVKGEPVGAEVDEPRARDRVSVDGRDEEQEVGVESVMRTGRQGAAAAATREVAHDEDPAGARGLDLLCRALDGGREARQAPVAIV